ncbi:MAG TPA: excinuclease ABC subunit UvrA [Polyangiaceae bacterium]|nr:excinuclease ABC subunit UvrA [Polyangiaceae bacterium]
MQKTHLVGARTHNLRSVSVDLAEGELVCLTGVSGSGKSSLAVDTLYAEGQRRFVESFSPYARQFLERLERPPMDELEPVAAAVSVDRRAPVKSSRSTVATMADVEAFLSALFTREAVPVCSECGLAAVRTDARTAAASVASVLNGDGAVVTYPVRVGGTEEFLQTRERLASDGYRRLWVGGEARDLDVVRPSEAIAGSGVIEVVVDRIKTAKAHMRRLEEAIDQAWKRSSGTASVHSEMGVHAVREGLVCPKCARAFEPARAGLFSYQSPVGACATCRGFGRTIGVDWSKVVPNDALSIAKGAIRPWTGKTSAWERKVLGQYAKRTGIPLDAPWNKLTEKQRTMVFDGEGTWTGGKYPGVKAWFKWLETRTYKMHVRVFLARYRSYDSCASCHGQRLNETALGYRVGGLDLAAWHALELGDARRRLADLDVRTAQGELVRKELGGRLGYLERVGLGYLALDRPARTLSGGEAQRVSLTAALGSSLTGALFVIDEPTIGLHPTDVPPLVQAMRELARRGNATLVIEHDPLVVRSSDRVLELGPGAGALGGNLLFDGTPRELARRADLPTGRVLAQDAMPRAARERRKPHGWLKVKNARANNLRGIDVDIPLGVACAITGPSGSGKSSLAEDIVYRALARAKGVRDVETPGEHDALEGGAGIKKVSLVDQSPLGRTSRGNAATYTKAWDHLRARFASEPDARARGFTPSHFSFNVAKGRCEACAGEGYETVEMQFLADVALICPTCRGRRFQDDVLEIRYGEWSVAEMLERTVDEVLAKFKADAPLTRSLGPLSALGLGYLPLGQPLATLSGGEAQRVKLARALTEDLDGALIVLDEPSAGLHPSDVERLISALDALVRGGASVLIVEHDVAVMRAADWIIDLGPAGGKSGGTIVAQGSPDDFAHKEGATARALQDTDLAESVDVARAEQPSGPEDRAIVVENAREHNLREVSCQIPRGKFCVVTGPSGSGKSTLAFDVVFAEGQRRFLETLTPYARQFLPTMPRPDVDRVSGVPPSIALEQRTTRAGVNSTVATVTEVAHYLRLMFAKLGDQHCPTCDTPISTQSVDDIIDELRKIKGVRTLLAPAVQARKGTYLDVFTAAARLGIERAWADGKLVATDAPPRLAKTKEHTIDLVVFEGPLASLERAYLDRALSMGQGAIKVRRRGNDADGERLYSTKRSCQSCRLAVPELDPRWFSFNTKQGRCEACEGAGVEGGPEALLEGETNPCRACHGSRLSPVPRAVRLLGSSYHDMVSLSVARALRLAKKWKFAGNRARIAEAPHGELLRRLAFLEQVGLSYLSLDRAARTLSGGEMQRLRLSAQLGSGLTGALYVLDEPTIGLHSRDTARLLSNLRALAKTGSTVLVVEHDSDTIQAADYLVDLGPSGGRHGGRIVAAGKPSDVLANPDSPTGQALTGSRVRPLHRAATSARDSLVLSGATAHNLKKVDLRIPIGKMTVVAGVSGSGKSTLVRQVFYPALRQSLGLVTPDPLPFAKLTGAGHVARAIAVDQSPIGRTPRSVPATFLGIWDEIRRLFAVTTEAKLRGFQPTRFSFNSAKGGRCAACDGQGVISHEMSFLPDVVTPCEACNGTRFEPKTQEVRYLGLGIGDVLKLTAEEAATVFRVHPSVARPLATLSDLGVGYLQLGQGSNTLSGGEAQRLKLAAELTAKARHEPTVYVLDEPTTGLHQGDVMRLIDVLYRLVDRGDTLVVIEHHPSVIASAEHVVELGPEGGEEGGHVVAEGTPRDVAKLATATGKVLAHMFADNGRRTALGISAS